MEVPCETLVFRTLPDEVIPVCVFETPFGRAVLTAEDGAVVSLKFGTSRPLSGPETPLEREALRELGEYFMGRRKQFEVPLAPRGTEFERKVWSAMRRIPYGGTESYGGLAARIGNPRACRAVGGACHRNPIPVFVPCHRVVAACGPGGFGLGLPMKMRLLALERRGK